MYITSTHILTCCFFCLLVMTDLKALCLSVDEAIVVWKDLSEWEAKLVSVAATKDSRTVKRIVSVLGTHGYSKKCKMLKGM